MKKIFKISIISVFTVAIFGYVFAQETIDIKSVSADFVQEKHLKILAKPMISKGKLYYQAPGSLRWEYFNPIRSVLLVHEGDTKRYIIKDTEIIEDSSAKMQSMHIVMNEITMWLSGKYDQNPDFKVKHRTKKTIVLVPIKESFSKIISQIDIYLSQRPGVIRSVIIREGNDSFTRLDFKNVILNKTLNDSLFKEI
jgi:outer membrane lipoprotein-sorting protein